MPASTLVVVVLAMVLVALALVIILRAPRRPAADALGIEGLPPGRVVYSDADGAGRALVARHYPLAGKPDYVVLADDGTRIPIELKSAHVGARPRPEDILQLGVYLMILDDLYTPTPTYGVLRYANRSFDVPYTPALRDDVLAVVARLEEASRRSRRLFSRRETAPAGTPAPSLCRGCAFRAICPDAWHQE